MQKQNVVVLVSGNGSNLQSLIDIQKLNLLPINITGVVADKQCLALQRAQIAGISTALYEYNKSHDLIVNEQNLVSLIKV